MLITHDLGVVAEMCDTVAVMYAGSVVEYSAVHELFNNPKHPYTRGLLNSIPRPGSDRLRAIDGRPPSLTKLPPGCRFANRCPIKKSAAINRYRPSRKNFPGMWPNVFWCRWKSKGHKKC